MEVENIPSLHRALQQAEVVVAEANAIVIWDNESYRFACEFQKKLYAADRLIESEMETPKSTTHDAHKAVCDLENKYRDPIKESRKINGAKIDTWEMEEEAKRLQEELNLRKEARKRDEERRLETAEDLEEEGRPDEAEAALEKRPGPAPILQSSVPMVGGMRRRPTWAFRVLNAEKVPSDYRCLDLQKIGAIVRATKGTILIPGIEVYDAGRTK